MTTTTTNSNVSAFDGLFNSFFTNSQPQPQPGEHSVGQDNTEATNTNQSVNVEQVNGVVPVTQPVNNQQPAHPVQLTQSAQPVHEQSIDNQPAMAFLETPILPEEQKLFDINTFVNELRENDAKQNKEYSLKNTNMSAYDVASGCIGDIVMKILNYPVQDYGSAWLPIKMRGCIGEGVHNFIQSESRQFTETEGSLKIPSINFSGRFDAMIGNNNLIEIKSCTYDDYKKIIKNQQPRVNDFYQLMTYKYILENYLEEAQRQPLDTLRTPPPKQKSYNIDVLQLIFVCHQIFSADSDNITKAMAEVKAIKQLLNSKHNQFYFMTALTINLANLDIAQYIDPIKKKIDRVNYYIGLNQLPDKADEFIDRKACFFCSYKSNCPYK